MPRDSQFNHPRGLLDECSSSTELSAARSEPLTPVAPKLEEDSSTYSYKIRPNHKQQSWKR